MVRKGTYILIIKLVKPTEIRIGRLGEFEFEAGYYAYVGSALNSLDGRLRRYFGVVPVKKHWHIDYFLREAEPVTAYYHISSKRTECRAAGFLGSKYPPPVGGFGSSDCRCKGHLFYLGKKMPGSFRKTGFKLRELAFRRWR
jgi:Uri superfamily endonuclease